MQEITVIQGHGSNFFSVHHFGRFQHPLQVCKVDTAHQDLDHFDQHKCHKREGKQKRATRVSLALVPCEIHWEKVCATYCDHLCVEFWLPFIVKLARAPYLCGWPCGDFGLLLTKKKKSSPVLVIGGERERLEKYSSLVDSSTGIRFSRTEPR